MLSEHIPPAKVSSSIKSVLKCFLTGLNVMSLSLPKERCVGYMRTDELKTVCVAHKAKILLLMIKKKDRSCT